MKFKVKYVYLAVIIIAAIIIIVSGISYQNTSETAIVPNDEIHEGMTPDMGSGDMPGKSNVSSEFMHQLEMYKKAVEENPTDTLKLRKLAELLSAAHNAEEGNKYFLKIIEIDPSRTDILTNIVFNYYSMQDIASAEKYNSEILKIDADNLDALYNKGVLEASKGNTEAAKKSWEKVIEKASDSELAELAKSNIARLTETK